jgi:hypothetical protein
MRPNAAQRNLSDQEAAQDGRLNRAPAGLHFEFQLLEQIG